METVFKCLDILFTAHKGVHSYGVIQLTASRLALIGCFFERVERREFNRAARSLHLAGERFDKLLFQRVERNIA